MLRDISTGRAEEKVTRSKRRASGRERGDGEERGERTVGGGEKSRGRRVDGQHGKGKMFLPSAREGGEGRGR